MTPLQAVSTAEAEKAARAARADSPREALRAFMDAVGFNEDAVSAALHLTGKQGGGQVRQYLDGERDDLDELVTDFLRLDGIEVLPTRNLAIVFKVCDHAHRRGQINVVASRSGFGKTTGLLAYARTKGAVYVSHDKTASRLEFLVNLLAAAGVHWNHLGSTAARIRRFTSRMIELGRPLLIVDEADTLTFACLEIARTINDRVRGGLILAGIDGYVQPMLLRAGHGFRPEQAAGRVAAIVRLPDPDADDVARLAGEYGVNAPTAILFLVERAAVLGGLRRVRVLLDDAKEIAEAQRMRSITIACLKEAANYVPEDAGR